MDPFECSGLWWSADDPTHRIAGVLRFSHENGLVLTLLGILGESGGPVGVKSHRVLLGSVYDFPKSQHITLKDCLQTRYTVTSSGISTEEYRPERAFLGHHLINSDDFRFSDCSICTSGLSSWAVHLTGIRFEHPEGNKEEGWQFRVAYFPPPPLEGAIPSGVIRLSIGAGTRNTLRELSVTEEVSLDMTLAEPIEVENWNTRFVYPLLNFLTLATDVPNALTKWELSIPNQPYRRVEVVGPRIFHIANRDGDTGNPEVLLPLEKLEDRFGSLISRWLYISEQHRDACNIFFGLRYAPGAYLDMRLLGISQALDLYYGARSNRSFPNPGALPSDIIAAVPPEIQEALRRWEAGVTFDTFRTTLWQLAKEHQTTLAPLSPQGLDALVEKIIAIRDYAIYRKKASSVQDGFGPELFFATETLACLMKSCFLAELGLSSEERAYYFRQNAMYNFLISSWGN